MSKGFINLHRQLLDWEWFDNSQMVHLWIYFLLKANYQEGKWHGVDIPRGSFMTSLESIRKDTRLTTREIRTCLSKLKTTGEVTIKSTNKYSIITICNYEKYNLFKEESDKQNDIQIDKQATSKRQTSDKQATTDNKYNNINKEIEEIKKENIKLKEELANASKKKRKIEELDFSIVSHEFVAVVKDWIEYKKERGEGYKPKGFEAFYKKLIELSGNSPFRAKEIIEQSKSNNYAGIFPLKEKSQNSHVEYKREPGRFDETIRLIKEWGIGK